jgi:hypothetical protein
MSDTTLVLTQKQHTAETFLKLVDNLDGTYSVSVNGTVIGTVTANLSATDNAVLDDIAANQTDGTQQSKVLETIPTDATKMNPSVVYTYDSDGNLSTITKTIGAVLYRRTFTYTSGALTAATVWSVV